MKYSHTPTTQARPWAADWRSRAIAIYQAGLDREITEARRVLAERLRALIEQPIAPEIVYIDSAERIATVVVDGTLFHSRCEDLTLVRACAYCGSGEFESPPLWDAADVGYALSAWHPAHPNCQDEDSPYWLYAAE